MNAPVHNFDTQAALGFVTHQRTHIEPEVLKKEYPEITYSQMIPVDSSAPEWAPSVTFFTQDQTGQAKFINGKGDDIPLVGLTMGKFEQTVAMAGIGYGFSLEEVGAAQQLNRNLNTEGADAAVMAYEQMVDRVAFLGDSQLGVVGLFNATGITEVAAGALIAAMTPQEILALINGQITAIMAATNGIELADTVVLPLAVYGDIATRQLAPESDRTVMDFIQRSNVYTMRTGQPLMIMGSHRLTNTIMIYRRDPRVLKMHMPMPLRFIPPQARGLEIIVYGMFRFAPVSIRKPGAFRRITGVA